MSATCIALEQYGCSRENEKLQIVWDTPENIARKLDQLHSVFNGCKCKTGCTTRRCKCNKENNRCGPGCNCLNCSNTMTAHHEGAVEELEIEEVIENRNFSESELTDDSEDDLVPEIHQDKKIDEIMHFVFGVDYDSD